MAFYELCVDEEKSPFNNPAIVRSLTNLQQRLHVARGQVDANSRRQNIDLTKGLINRFFDQRSPPSISTGAGLEIRLSNALRRSKVETAAFEAKQGFLNLDINREKNSDVSRKVIETICGIANIGPHSDGAVFIGVVDNESDANRISQLDSITPIKTGDRFVVGIDREALLAGQSLDVYTKVFTQEIASSGLSEPLKTEVLSRIDVVDYRSMSVICIWVPPQKQLSTLDDEVYSRHGAETVRVSAFSELQALQSLFT